MTEFRKSYANVKRGQIHYAEAGEGPPLLLIGETPRGYRFFHNLLPLLAPHVRAIAVDLPGLGNSHSLPEPMSVPAMAECLVDFLDALGLTTTNVFGMHTGDKVATALAAGFPERVDRFIIAGQTHSLIPEKEKRNAALTPSFKRYHAAKEKPGDKAARRMRDWLAAKLTLDATWWPDKVASAESAAPDLFDLSEAQSIDFLLGWKSAVPIYKAVFDYDMAEAVARVKSKTLVLEFLTTEEEHFGSQADRLAGLMRHATAASIRVTYLSAMEDQAGEIADAVLKFLSAIDG